MADSLELRFQRIAGSVICRPAGEIDLSSSASFREQLCAAVEASHLVVDLSGVTFVDSTALGALVAASNRARATGTTIHLAGATGQVKKVLQLTKLDVHLDHHDQLADAVEAMLVAADGHVPS